MLLLATNIAYSKDEPHEPRRTEAKKPSQGPVERIGISYTLVGPCCSTLNALTGSSIHLESAVGVINFVIHFPCECNQPISLVCCESVPAHTHPA